ncbi:Asp-tRNA(Asn)/Glu-tRNA(Gln) amidotransferase subunit GatB [Candidatus Saccharibacteria bacterium]|nr:Asp-tRNA(Asn)/Glu-tRNA(Gln) amidotransferase subunit GatB [Candidatus Saccharibacteria bacterium]
MSKYEATIGIECHVQLATKTKLFSEVDNDARGKEPNSCVSPVDYALPGMLPRLNGEAIRYAIRAGKAMNCAINPHSRFDRKHYFYPDSPKGFQITQFYHPIIGAGYVELPSGTKVRINHAHLEGDAGKLTHYDTYSLVDLNRVDTPLIEIVSEPDIHTAKDAHDYCKELWRLMCYAGVTNGDLYNGNMRFDVNTSIAPVGSKTLGTRTEVKNLNSFRSVERAIEYEIKRQSKLLDNGKKVIQETLGWSDATGETTGQRSKEEAKDYRYMPEPDIPPINLSEEFIKTEMDKVPMLPNDYRAKFGGVIANDTLEVLLDYPQLMMKLGELSDKSIKNIANLFSSVLLAEEKSTEMLQQLPTGAQLEELSEMKEKGELSSTGMKEVFAKLFDPQMRSKDTRTIAKELNVIQENDTGALEAIVDSVIADQACAQAVADYKAGSEKVLGFLVGQVMKASRGKANPAAAQEILKTKLK